MLQCADDHGARIESLDIIVTMDADDTHAPGLVLRMVRMISEGHDVVIASRYRPGSRPSGHRVWWVEGLGQRESRPTPALPPAPLSSTRWYLGPYLFNWARRASYYLESHGQKAEVLDTKPGGAVLPYENVAVTMVSGWH